MGKQKRRQQLLQPQRKQLPRLLLQQQRPLQQQLKLQPQYQQQPPLRPRKKKLPCLKIPYHRYPRHWSLPQYHPRSTLAHTTTITTIGTDMPLAPGLHTDITITITIIITEASRYLSTVPTVESTDFTGTRNT